MNERRARTLLIVGAGVWCLAILIAPLTGSRVLYEFFGRICNQLPERSWRIAGTPLPVCIRCASIYAGFFASAVVRWKPDVRCLKSAIAISIIEFVVGVTWIDLAALRAITGFLLGAAVAPFVKVAIEEMITTVQSKRAGGFS